MLAGDPLLHERHRVDELPTLIELLHHRLDQLNLVFSACLIVEQLLQEVSVLLRLPNEAGDYSVAHPVFAGHLCLGLVVNQHLMDYANLLPHCQRLPLTRTSPQPHGRLWHKVRFRKVVWLRLFLLTPFPDLFGQLLNVIEALPLSLSFDVVSVLLTLLCQFLC